MEHFSQTPSSRMQADCISSEESFNATGPENIASCQSVFCAPNTNIANNAVEIISHETPCDLMQANHSYTPCSTIEGATLPRLPNTAPELKNPSTLEEQLLAAGITPQLLMNQWGIVLWSIRAKSDRVKLKVDARRLLDDATLESLGQWFEGLLNQRVSISLRNTSQCCDSPCKGCLWADTAKRTFWSQAINQLAADHFPTHLV